MRLRGVVAGALEELEEELELEEEEEEGEVGAT